MKRSRAVVTIASAALLWFAAGAPAQEAHPLERLQFLVGTWDSPTGDTQLGSGSGSASFTRELNARVIVRRSFAEYRTGPQAGTRHDDLMVIYHDAPSAPVRAVYFDSEGHVIRYVVVSAGDDAVVFQTDGSDSGPQYRLSYTRSGKNLNGKFEIAAPGAEYKTYLSWTAIKRQ